MFKPETIRKVMAIAQETGKAYYQKVLHCEEYALCISRGNRKIGRVMNVSLMPIMTCGNCAACKGYCYDVKACAQYPATVIDARMRNTIMAKYNRGEYWRQIDDAITARTRFFRWHVAGDILDADYLRGMVYIAQRHPGTRFWTYTKMYYLVNEYIDAYGPLPENMTVMFSEWDGVPMENPHNMPVFACRLKAGNKDRSPESFDAMHKCPGNCDACIAGRRGCPYGESSYADEH